MVAIDVPWPTVHAHLGDKHNQISHGRGTKQVTEREWNPVTFEGSGGAAGKFNEHKGTQFINDGWAGWSSELSVGEQNALREYTGNADNITGYLRGEHDASVFETPFGPPPFGSPVDNIDRSFARPGARLPADVALHRGVRGDYARSLHDAHTNGTLVGASHRNPAYTSTTLDPGKAETLAGYDSRTGFSVDDDPAGRAIIHIEGLARQPAIAPGSLSSHPTEYEVMLPRNSTLLFTGSNVNQHGVLEVTARIVP